LAGGFGFLICRRAALRNDEGQSSACKSSDGGVASCGGGERAAGGAAALPGVSWLPWLLAVAAGAMRGAHGLS